MNVLDTLCAAAKTRVEANKKLVSLDEMRRRAEKTDRDGAAFERALSKDGMSFICEIKRASPSKGLIAPDFPYLDIAQEYAAAGADAISVLTEPTQFLGNNDYLTDVAAAVDTPILRKDFTVDEYMLFEAKSIGASAVLLICAALGQTQLADYIAVCDGLKLATLVEAHDEREIETALKAGARIVGVNNRNLKDFSVNTDNSRRLRKLVPKDVIFVAESGIRVRTDIVELENAGVDAVLVGETLMRAPDRIAALHALRGDV